MVKKHKCRETDPGIKDLVNILDTPYDRKGICLQYLDKSMEKKFKKEIHADILYFAKIFIIEFGIFGFGCTALLIERYLNGYVGFISLITNSIGILIYILGLVIHYHIAKRYLIAALIFSPL